MERGRDNVKEKRMVSGGENERRKRVSGGEKRGERENEVRWREREGREVERMRGRRKFKMKRYWSRR